MMKTEVQMREPNKERPERGVLSPRDLGEKIFWKSKGGKTLKKIWLNGGGGSRWGRWGGKC